MKTLYFDCAMGAAGDMLTAALLELHPDREDFLRRMNTALKGKAVITAEDDCKCGIKGTHVHVLIDGQEEGAARHDTETAEEQDHHPHHRHTGLKEVMDFIDAVALPEQVRTDAKAVFSLIARAESKVHGCEIENIHFHEVGSLDALADVLNVCQLIHELAPEKILASPVAVGSGTVKCAHGILPVPAPATELILRDIPVYAGSVKAELCTPTGAALLKHFVTEFGPMPVLRISAVGYGTGKKDFETANVVRALWGETEEAPERIYELACNLDDMTAEDLSFAMDRLFEAGALDVTFTDIGMKKCRPAVMLTCMCHEYRREAILQCLFRHTTTLGVREYVCNRYQLRRSFTAAQTDYGPVRVKVSEGYGVCRRKPEYEDLAALAREHGLPLSEIRKQIK